MTPSSRILIADPEPAEREMFRAVLAPLGYELVFVSDGEETLLRAEETPPDLGLLDVRLPKLDGFEVCRRLRANPQLAELPLILVTAQDEREARLAGIEAGADDFISKPVDRVEVLARVHTITRLNRYRRLLAEGRKFERIADHSLDGYVQLNERGEVTYANPQACVYLGLLPGELSAHRSFLELAQTVYRFEPADAWAGWPNPVPQGQPSRHLIRPEAGPSPALWLRVETLSTPAHEEAGLLLRLRDVTQPVGFQRDLWRFRTLLSHKLCPPMNGLLGSLETLADPDTAPTRKETTDFAGAAMSCAQRLQTQIQDVLQFVDAPALSEETTQPFAIRELPDLANRLAQTLGIYAVTARVEAGLETSRMALSGATLRTVLTEILENAKKFHPQHTPTVNVEIARRPDDLVVLQVSDNGSTVPPERLAHFWRPYYLGENGFTGKVPGLGLGLGMIASLVWEKGGECRMHARTPGPGVLIEVVLPLAP